jgi:hypothetical protein
VQDDISTGDHASHGAVSVHSRFTLPDAVTPPIVPRSGERVREPPRCRAAHEQEVATPPERAYVCRLNGVAAHLLLARRVEARRQGYLIGPLSLLGWAVMAAAALFGQT